MQCFTGHLVSWSISSFTLTSSANILLGDWKKKIVGVGNHLTFQFFTSNPSPILHERPYWSKSHAPIILCHANDGHLHNALFKIVPLG